MGWDEIVDGVDGEEDVMIDRDGEDENLPK